MDDPTLIIAAIDSVLVGSGLMTAFVVGAVLVFRSIRHGRAYPRCGGCGYDLSGSLTDDAAGRTSYRCPECGSGFASVGIIPPGPHRRPALTIVGLALILSSVGLGLGLVAETRHRASAQQVIIQIPPPPQAPRRLLPAIPPSESLRPAPTVPRLGESDEDSDQGDTE